MRTMTVTILPITPGKHNSFVTLFGPLIADVFSRLTNNPLKLVLNVIHSFYSFEKEAQKYLHQLGCLDIKPSSIVYDNSDGYQNHIQCIVKDLFDRGFLKVETMDMVHCNCGVVELPSSVYRTIQMQERRKYILQSGRCIKCKSELKKNDESVLELRLPKLNIEISFYPLIYKGQLEQSVAANERPIIISRNHRDGVIITLNKQKFILDTDFCWMVYLEYLNDDSFSIISGSDTINHVIKAIKLLSVYRSKPKIILIIHPLLRVLDSKVKLSKSTIDDYLGYCSTPQFARTFLMLGAQWQKSEVTIKALNLHLVEKSIYPKQMLSSISNATVVTPENFCNIVNSNKILELLKTIRSYQTKLSSDQIVLKSALLGEFK